MNTPAYKREVPARTIAEVRARQDLVGVLIAGLVFVTVFVGTLVGVATLVDFVGERLIASLVEPPVADCGDPETLLEPECFAAMVARNSVTHWDEHGRLMNADDSYVEAPLTMMPSSLELHDGTMNPAIAIYTDHNFTINGRVVIHGKCGDFVIDMDHNTVHSDLTFARPTPDKDCQ